MRYFIRTFGCQQNIADSERIASFYEARGFEAAKDESESDTIVLNTCVVRERAAEKVFGMVKDLAAQFKGGSKGKTIVITGCLIGAATREPSGKMMKKLRERMTEFEHDGLRVEFLPLEEVGFEYAPKRTKGKLASIPISEGCNNYCAYCIVPFSRGRERSRAFEDIVSEAEAAAREGYEEIMLLGQNVNSYGADFLTGKLKENSSPLTPTSTSGSSPHLRGAGKCGIYVLPDGTEVVPVMVKHLNRHRIPTLFPYLLERVAKIPGVKKISFMSSNPWDFSDELIDVIARNGNISRLIHLPVQAGSDEVIKNMNRWYTRDEYMALVDKIRERIPGAEITTDIIVGFPGETEEQFEQTMDLARRVKFKKAYIAWYSPRPGTAALKMKDDVPFEEKKRRWVKLDKLANAHEKRNL